MDNNVLIRSGEARLVGWSRQMLYLGFITLPRSVFWLADLNGRSDNTDVIPLNPRRAFNGKAESRNLEARQYARWRTGYDS